MCIFFFFFFTDPATTEIYTLSLHDALPISVRTRHAQRVRGADPADVRVRRGRGGVVHGRAGAVLADRDPDQDRKSTRLNSSHPSISYAVFCLKKKKQNKAHMSKSSPQPRSP